MEIYAQCNCILTLVFGLDLYLPNILRQNRIRGFATSKLQELRNIIVPFPTEWKYGFKTFYNFSY